LNQECFDIWKGYFACKLDTLGNNLAIAQSYQTSKEKCYREDLTIASFLFIAICNLCFYTEAEQEADEDLTTGDKLGCLTHNEVMTIIYKLKSILTECGC